MPDLHPACTSCKKFAWIGADCVLVVLSACGIVLLVEGAGRANLAVSGAVLVALPVQGEVVRIAGRL